MVLTVNRSLPHVSANRTRFLDADEDVVVFVVVARVDEELSSLLLFMLHVVDKEKSEGDAGGEFVGIRGEDVAAKFNSLLFSPTPVKSINNFDLDARHDF